MATEATGGAAVAVIDDEESMREGCRQMLESQGYRTTVAASGESGLRLIEISRPNVALVDLLLPDINGIEVIEKIHEIDPHIVAIVITGYASTESATQAMRAGAFDYLAKPFEPENLVEVVANGVEQSRLGKRSAALERKKEMALANFAAIVCHQLRSPVAAAAQWIEVLRTERAGPLNPEQRSMLERAATRMDYLSTSIGDWLRLAEVEAGGIKLDAKAVELPRVIEQAWKAIPDEEGRGRIDFELRGGYDVRPVRGQQNLLRELFTNLFTNSVKFTSGPGKVTVKLTAEENNTVVSINDTGLGIPQEELPHLFDPFYRGARAGTRRIGGHGLGLAVAKKVVSVHGGTICASSVPGQGATFTLRLPAKATNRGIVSVHGDSAPGRGATFILKLPSENGRKGEPMRNVDVVVVGGSAAGLTAAITARRHCPGRSILVIRKEEQVLIPCGIPYIFGTVGTPGKNLIPDAVLEKNDVSLLVDEVVEVDRDSHQLTTAGGEAVRYKKLILATGSIPSVPPIPGRQKENIFVVQKSVGYLQKMLDKLESTHDLVVVGGGFIGMEFADECRKGRDINISVVEMLPHCLMLSFDDDICKLAEAVAKDGGIEIIAPEKVEAFVGNGKVTGVKLASGQQLKADMVIIGAGCRANVKLGEQMGLEIGPTGGIQVDHYMATADPDVFACGDCAEKKSFFDGEPSRLKLASTATKEARIVGANLFGKRRLNEGVLGVWSTVVAETAFAGAGLSEAEAERKGYDVVVGQAESVNRHPGGMSGASKLKVKLIFEKGTQVLLGGQVAGAKCGGEVINVISACIHEKMIADQLATFPMGTHPALTASPIAYQLTNAAEMAIKACNEEREAAFANSASAAAAK